MFCCKRDPWDTSPSFPKVRFYKTRLQYRSQDGDADPTQDPARISAPFLELELGLLACFLLTSMAASAHTTSWVSSLSKTDS